MLTTVPKNPSEPNTTVVPAETTDDRHLTDIFCRATVLDPHATSGVLQQPIFHLATLGVSSNRMRLAGIPVRDEDIHTLIDLLLRVGRADDLKLAARLDRALELEAMILALGTNERATILSVLDDPPEGLAELRGTLARDQRERFTG